MRLDQDSFEPLEFIKLHNHFRPRLQRLAENLIGSLSDEADEAVQRTFIFVLSNQDRIPSSTVATERWLIAILKRAVLNVRSRHIRHRFKSRAGKPRLMAGKPLSGGVTTDSSETTEHSIAVGLAISPPGDDDRFDEIICGLDVQQRQLLFDRVTSESDHWERRREQAALRAKLQTMAPKPSRATPKSRIIDFVRSYAEIRNWESPESYVSAYRVLERKTGGWLRLRDLDDAFLEKYVLPLSLSSRKRLLAVWNAAASTGVINPPSKHARQSAAPHPVNWSVDEISRAVNVAEKMQGEVGTTGIPKKEYWPALVCLAADSGLSHTDLLELTWTQLRLNDGFKYRAKAHTVEFLRTLRKRGHEMVFPWSGAKEGFYKNYGRLVRESGMARDGLTPREWDVLRGTAEGGTEKVLAERLGCGIGTIRDYRKRLREKLNIRGTWSIRKLVATAREQGLITDGIT